MGLALIAVGAIALILIAPRLASAAPATPSAATVAQLSIEQLAAQYVGRPVAGTPPVVNQRFVEHWNQVKASGQEGWVVHGIDPGESARLGASWHYLVGRLPDVTSAGWLSPPAPPGLIWRRTDVKRKQSGLGAVFGSLLPAAANLIAPGSGTIIGSV